MDEDGSMILYTNGGPGNGGWVWLPQGKVGTGVGATREQIRLAYIFGHGRADYVSLFLGVLLSRGRMTSFYISQGSKHSKSLPPGPVHWYRNEMLTSGNL